MTLSKRHALFGAAWLSVALMFAGVIAALVDLSRRDMTASHLVLVPFVTAVLVFQARATIFAAAETAWGAGTVVMLAGLGVFVVAGNQGLTVAVASLVAMWIGCFLLIYGSTASRAALFPLLFLAFMIPIPGPLLDGAVAMLKGGSAEVVSHLFALTGTPFHRAGFVFTLPHVTIEVADECSGIRSSIALLITAILAGHMFLESAWTRAVLVLAILPVTILKNGIRIVSLTLLAKNDPAYLQGRLHQEGGLVFFLLALGILAPLFVLLRRSDIGHPGMPRHT